MLLDFNLARNWSFGNNSSPLDELGGTLTYMAPERLGLLASAGSGPIDTCQSSEMQSSKAMIHTVPTFIPWESSCWKPSRPCTPGEVMRDRDVPEPAEGAAQTRRGPCVVPRAGLSASIRAFESAACRTIPPALHAILERCLAVAPARPVSAGVELAEDLDRWRADLPLAYAPEPFWAQTFPAVCGRTRSCSLP